MTTKKPKHSRPAPPAAEPDALDKAVANAIATVQADVAKAGKAKAGNLTSDPAASPKKKAAKALKAAKAATKAPAPPVVPDAGEVLLDAIVATDAQNAALAQVGPASLLIAMDSVGLDPGSEADTKVFIAQLEKAIDDPALATPPDSAQTTPHLDPETGLWIPKNPNHGKKEPKPPKAAKPPKEPKPPKAPKALKPLKEVAGQPSRGPNSTTAVVSMKVPLKSALAKAATSNMRSLSAQAASYILDGLKRDGFIQDHPPMTDAPKAAEDLTAPPAA